MSMDAAATIPVCLGTAAIGILSPAPTGLALDTSMTFSSSIYKDKAALVIGGSTSTGQFAIQLFRLLGFSKIIAYASTRHADHLKSLGATTCIDRASTPLTELATMLASEPITAIFDSVGKPDAQQAASDCLKSGTFVSVAVDARHNKTPDVAIVWVRGSVLLPGNPEFNGALGKNLSELLESGKVVPSRPEVLPGGLSAVDAGIQRLFNGDVSGSKLVVHPHDL